MEASGEEGKMICVICSELLGDGEVTTGPCFDKTPSVTSCGHIFHKHCLLTSFDFTPADDDGHDSPTRCPTCRSTIKPEDIRSYYGSSDLFCKELKERVAELAAREETGAVLTTEVDWHHKRRQNSFLFVQPGILRDDASCFNCESFLHLTRSCAHDLVIRHTVKIGSRRHPCITFCRSARAGFLLSDFENRMKIGRPLSRAETQFVFTMYHFGRACTRCGEPECDCATRLCPSSKQKNL